MSNILVTGGAGFIGSHLVSELVAKKHQVTVIDNFSSGDRANLNGALYNIKLVSGDIRDKSVIARECAAIDMIVHLAAQVSVPESIDQPQHTFNVNEAGTFNVLEVARVAKIKRVILASSASVYGDALKNKAKSLNIETDAVDPVSPYALSKIAAENWCRLYTQVYGLDTICLRFFNVYGPRQNEASSYANVIPGFLKRLRLNQSPIIHGSGEQSRDFIYVDDVVRAIVASLRVKEGKGQIVNIGSGKDYSIKQLFNVIKQVLDSNMSAVFEPGRSGDVFRTRASTRRASQFLKFSAKVTLEQGVRKILAVELGKK